MDQPPKRQEKRLPGRPPGKAYPVIKQIRLSEQHAGRLERLAQRLGETEAGVMRAGIDLLAEREGLT